MYFEKEKFKKSFIHRVEDKYGKAIEYTGEQEKYIVLAEMIRGYAGEGWKQTREVTISENRKKLYYFSMEFLMGRLLTNNLMNLGIYDDVELALSDLGIKLHDLEIAEDDAGLGNGGLGRLAACFLDSIASLGYPGSGISIRYQYGFFRQKIEKFEQTELVDPWLVDGMYEWESPRIDEATEIGYGGTTNTYFDENGKMRVEYIPETRVLAVPYDVPIIGYDQKATNTLRLFKAEPILDYPIAGGSFEDYERDTRSISNFLYPDDSTGEGKRLRLRQQYFFSAAGLRWILKRFLYENDSFANLHEKVVIQINDTHPTLVIPELMRILIDEHNYEWADAWNITTKTVAYTNHTILAEALEKWPVEYIRTLFPRLWQIIEEIDRRFRADLFLRFKNTARVEKMAIISDNQVKMAHLAVCGSFSVNGVAYLHTEILKAQELADFYEVYPDKFNNKTNGITHRRWLAYANRPLADFITKKVGNEWMLSPQEGLLKLLPLASDSQTQLEFLAIKKLAKQKLADYVFETRGITLNIDSIFDIQIKRLHAYKRQLLNLLHIIYLYNRMKEDPNFKPVPRTFIFAAKAAPSYYFAKKVIKLMNILEHKINNDEDVNKHLQVIFLENYNVSLGELLFPAADVSEQISTAGKEASGTGNMKFMMNGALTIGTMDGANVEIFDLVGNENIAIFGLDNDAINKLRQSNTYVAWDYYHSDLRIQKAIDFIAQPEKIFAENQLCDKEFSAIVEELLMHNDEYFILKDFDSYANAQEMLCRLYSNQPLWAQKCLINIARSGFFTSDRTIEQYVEDIWKIEKIQ
ncbi:MAG: glycogen/starch/alpha-glucan phosphorylase [Culicoidibacterales bacterium]